MIRWKPWAGMCLLGLPVLLALGGIGGCSQVRLLSDNPDGGVVSIPSNSNQWPTYYRNRAEYLMRKKCPQGYVIVREQVEEDNPAADDGRKPNENFEYNGAYERISNYRREAYHITFRRKGAAPPANLDAPAKAIPAGPPVPPRLPATEKDKEELPPPRRLPSREGEG
jgi:hypothetical protein